MLSANVTPGRAGVLPTVAWLAVPNLAMFMVYMGILQVLLPIQVETLAPADKVAQLGWVTGVGALVATLSNPVAGMLSDRTHGPWGRRAPWLLGAALAAVLALVCLGQAATLMQVTLAFCIVQMIMNAFQGVITAVLPERVPVAQRGLASSVVGLCFPAGIVLGSALCARFADRVAGGYGALGGVLIAATLVFLLFNRDLCRPWQREQAARAAPEAASPAGFFSAFRSGDFRWTFVSRFFVVLAFAMISGFQLYLLQDHVRVPAGRSATDALVDLNALSMACMAAATLLAGPLSDALGGRRRIFVLAAAVCMGVSLVWLLLRPDEMGLRIYGIVNGLAFGAYLAVDAALITQVLPDERHVARDLGILNMATAGPQILAPFLASHIVGHLGGYPALLALAAAAAVVSGLAILKVRGVR